MNKAMILHAFTGDHATGWRNRQSNELLFTALNDTGNSFSAVIPGAMQIQLLAPSSRTLQVTTVTRDGEVFHAQLARFEDEPQVHSGVYLASMSVVVFVPPTGDFKGTAIASVTLDEDLPAIPRPPEGGRTSATRKRNKREKP